MVACSLNADSPRMSRGSATSSRVAEPLSQPLFDIAFRYESLSFEGRGAIREGTGGRTRGSASFHQARLALNLLVFPGQHAYVSTEASLIPDRRDIAPQLDLMRMEDDPETCTFSLNSVANINMSNSLYTGVRNPTSTHFPRDDMEHQRSQ